MKRIIFLFLMVSLTSSYAEESSSEKMDKALLTIAKNKMTSNPLPFMSGIASLCLKAINDSISGVYAFSFEERPKGGDKLYIYDQLMGECLQTIGIGAHLMSESFPVDE